VEPRERKREEGEERREGKIKEAEKERVTRKKGGRAGRRKGWREWKPPIFETWLHGLFAPLGVLVSCCCLDVYSSFLVFSRLSTLVISELPVFYCHLDNGITTYGTFLALVFLTLGPELRSHVGLHEGGRPPLRRP